MSAPPVSNSSPLAGEEGARARKRVGRRGGQRDLLSLAKRMRAEQTDAERRLWSILRGKRLAGWKFKRQEQIGNFIVYCHMAATGNTSLTIAAEAIARERNGEATIRVASGTFKFVLLDDENRPRAICEAKI